MYRTYVILLPVTLRRVILQKVLAIVSLVCCCWARKVLYDTTGSSVHGGWEELKHSLRIRPDSKRREFKCSILLLHLPQDKVQKD